MPRDAESLKIKPWAATGDRTDPDDASLTPVIDRAVGWPASFSQSGGNTPRRQVMNQLWREVTGMLDEINRHGVLEYSDKIDYVAGAFVRVDVKLYFALRANGPGESGGAVSPTASGQTAWEHYKGRNVEPSQVGAVVATPGNQQVSLSWALPLDGGQPITRFHVQYKLTTAQAWSASIYSTDANEVVASLTNGSVYQFRVAAENSVGVGDWSVVVSSAPVSGVPAAPEILRATPRDKSVLVDWTDADDGGSAITGHTIQWKSGAQSFDAGRSATAALSEHVVGGLSNGTEYTFRVRSNNANGSSAWSAEVTATPTVGFVRLTASQNFVWPWSTSRARVIVASGQGGDGGDGGGGGGGAGDVGHVGDNGHPGAGGAGGAGGVGARPELNGADGLAGSSGEEETTHTGESGGGGGSGGEGAKGEESTVTFSSSHITSGTGRGGKGGAGGKGGSTGYAHFANGGSGGGAAAGGRGGNRWTDHRDFSDDGSNGERGERGEQEIVSSELDGLSVGSLIVVKVGVGGGGGRSGVNGGGAYSGDPRYYAQQGSHGDNGADGVSGWVEIYPLY